MPLLGVDKIQSRPFKDNAPVTSCCTPFFSVKYQKSLWTYNLLNLQLWN